jgi:hypothetical protein
MEPVEWIKGLNRLKIGKNWKVPLTLQGGEPSVYKGWVDVIKGLDTNFYIDLLTNMSFDPYEFMAHVSAVKFKRKARYNSIRASYHPGQVNYGELLDKLKILNRFGYGASVYVVDHPDIRLAKLFWGAKHEGVDFRLKEFLGWHNDKLFGTYKWPEAVQMNGTRDVQCKTTEMLIAPDGYIHRCHRDLYSGENAVGHLLDKKLDFTFTHRECGKFGHCNACDIKIKTNRFQEDGTTSVDIKWIGSG